MLGLNAFWFIIFFFFKLGLSSGQESLIVALFLLSFESILKFTFSFG